MEVEGVSQKSPDFIATRTDEVKNRLRSLIVVGEVSQSGTWKFLELADH